MTFSDTDVQSATVEVTDASFAAEVLSADRPVLVDFRAAWCGQCQLVAPVLEEIARENPDVLTVAKLDVDANPVTARDFRIVSIPALILFRRGRPVRRIFGAKDKMTLLRELADVL